MAIKWTNEKWKIKDLKDYEKNPRKIDKEAFKKLIESLKSDGYHQRLLINQDGTIIGGHSRKKALLKAGYKESDELDVLVPDRLLEGEDFDRINIRDNLPYGSFDFDMLAEFFNPEQLIEWGMPEDWLKIIEPEIEVTEDDEEVPDLPTEAVTKLGDIWQLGEHRLMCGDSTSLNQLDNLLTGKQADALFTSPPYNGNTHIDYGKGKNHKLYKKDDDNKSSAAYIEFLQEILSNCFLKTDGFIFWNINYNNNSRFEFLKSLSIYIDKLWEVIIWKKTGMPLAAGLTRNHEFIFCFKTSDKRKHLGKPFETNYTIWEVDNKDSQIKGEHHACFPIELPLKGILLATEAGESVLDPFGGTGSTLIACEKSNRKCFMMELSPYYCDVIIARWEKLSKLKAILLTENSE